MASLAMCVCMYRKEKCSPVGALARHSCRQAGRQGDWDCVLEWPGSQAALRCVRRRVFAGIIPLAACRGRDLPCRRGSWALSRSRPRHLLLMGRWPETERGGRAPGGWVLPRRGWMGCTPCRLGYGGCPVSFDVEAVCTKGKYCEVSKACQSSPGDMYSTRDGVSLYSGEENRSVREFGGVWRSLEENLVRAYVLRQKSRLLRELQ